MRNAVTIVPTGSRRPRNPLVLRGWQWGFGAVAPLALIVIDLRLFGGWLLQVAPAAFWALAVLGPLLLALSQRRWSDPFDLVLSGMVTAAGGLALLAAVLPVLLYLVIWPLNGMSGGNNFLMGVMLTSAITLLFTWPLFLSASAFRRQAKLRLRRREFRSPAAVVGMVLLPLMLGGAEIGDRMYFASMRAKLGSKDIAVMLEGAKQFEVYPIALMTRTEDVCEPFYAQDPDSFVSAESLENQLDWSWGKNAQKVRAAARKLFGANAAQVCADALSSD